MLSDVLDYIQEDLCRNAISSVHISRHSASISSPIPLLQSHVALAKYQTTNRGFLEMAEMAKTAKILVCCLF